MYFETNKLLENVQSYDSFYTLEELDNRARELSKKYGFVIKEIGESFEKRKMYLIKAGEGPKKAFLWGFPHPNEPIGSLVIDWLINYFGKNPEKLKESGYTWYFMYTADPDGTLLNESWFKGNLTIERYMQGFYRPPANRMIDWTFPIEYKDFKWDLPMSETKVLMNLISEIKPDFMYPLHNSGFGGSYFFSTHEFDNEYYENIISTTKKLGIPLHLGEPEEDFMVEIKKPFYFDFGFKDYYEREIKMKRDPVNTLKHGDNSTGFLQKINPDAVVIKGEVPYFYDKLILDTSLSKKTRREIYLKMIEDSDSRIEFYKTFIDKILKNLKEPDAYWYLALNVKRMCERGNDNFKKLVLESEEYDRKATKAEEFDAVVINQFYIGLSYGQMRRAAIKANLNKSIIEEIEKRMFACADFVNENSEWKTFPIKTLVKLQLSVLFETLNAIERNN